MDAASERWYLPGDPPPSSGLPKLTPSQEKVLLAALRAHPRAVGAGGARTVRSLAGAGLLREGAEGAGQTLTEAGLDVASRIGAQRIIDAANTAGRDNSVLAQSRPGVSTCRAGAPPPGWPFRESHHAW